MQTDAREMIQNTKVADNRVKKVHIKQGNPFFLVSLNEHKSAVDYNVSMQIFRYMVYIWETIFCGHC